MTLFDNVVYIVSIILGKYIAGLLLSCMGIHRLVYSLSGSLYGSPTLS